MNYVTTVYGQNGQTATCNTYITVGNSYPSVTLSQIPYTGFDLGTMGDMLYWAFLALFALAAGYLTVYYKGGMATFAGGMIPARKTRPGRHEEGRKSETKRSHGSGRRKDNRSSGPEASRDHSLRSRRSLQFVRPATR